MTFKTVQSDIQNVGMQNYANHNLSLSAWSVYLAAISRLFSFVKHDDST